MLGVCQVCEEKNLLLILITPHHLSLTPLNYNFISDINTFSITPSGSYQRHKMKIFNSNQFSEDNSSI